MLVFTGGIFGIKKRSLLNKKFNLKKEDNNG